MKEQTERTEQAIADLEGFRYSLENKINGIVSKINGSKRTINEGLEKILTLEMGSPEYKKLSASLADHRLNIESQEHLLAKEREKMSNFDSIPEAKEKRNLIVQNMDAKLSELEAEREVIKTKIDALKEQSYILGAEYLAIHIQEDAILERVRRFFHNPTLQGKILINGTFAGYLLEMKAIVAQEKIREIYNRGK